jgi:predicted nucleic acid-binding protein
LSDFVCIDACVALKWVVPEADSSVADALFEHIVAQGDLIIAPPHMRVEVTNALRKKARRQEITPAEAEDALAVFLSFPIGNPNPDELHETALLLAQRFERPTVYDTHYVALAQLMNCVMWTADLHLLNALGSRLPFVKSLGSFRDET